MICKTKTISRAEGAYEAPTCKAFSILAESRILTSSPGSADSGDYDENPLEPLGD